MNNIVSTIYIQTNDLPEKLINLFAGNYATENLPNNVTPVSKICDKNPVFAYWNETKEVWEEKINQDELFKIEQQKPILIKKILNEKGIFLQGRDTDIQFDIYEFFKPQEKIFNLKGEPILKTYLYENKKVISIYYEKIKEPITHAGITKTEFVKSITKIVFHKENNQFTEEKIIETLPFDLQPQEVKNEAGNIIDVVWSSVKREEMLRNERYKSEEVIKSKNPLLYNMFTQVFATSWQRYKETGDKTNLVAELQNCPIPQIATKLKEQIANEDKLAFFGTTEIDFTILSLIINSLQ